MSITGGVREVLLGAPAGQLGAPRRHGPVVQPPHGGRQVRGRASRVVDLARGSSRSSALPCACVPLRLDRPGSERVDRAVTGRRGARPRTRSSPRPRRGSAPRRARCAERLLRLIADRVDRLRLAEAIRQRRRRDSSPPRSIAVGRADVDAADRRERRSGSPGTGSWRPADRTPVRRAAHRGSGASCGRVARRAGRSARGRARGRSLRSPSTIVCRSSRTVVQLLGELAATVVPVVDEGLHPLRRGAGGRRRRRGARRDRSPR